MKTIPISGALVLATLLQAGCGMPVDPYSRTDMWTPEGAPIGNLAAMLADPHDLIRGRSETAGNVRRPGAAVERLWLGRPAALPTASTTGFAPAAAAAPAPPPPPAAGGS